MRTTGAVLAGLTVWTLLMIGGLAQAVEPAHGVAMHGEPAYPADFTHFAYVNPDAPKGGSLAMAAIGTKKYRPTPTRKIHLMTDPTRNRRRGAVMSSSTSACGAAGR